jgi:hypothetical protein
MSEEEKQSIPEPNPLERFANWVKGIFGGANAEPEFDTNSIPNPSHSTGRQASATVIHIDLGHGGKDGQAIPEDMGKTANNQGQSSPGFSSTHVRHDDNSIHVEQTFNKSVRGVNNFSNDGPSASARSAHGSDTSVHVSNHSMTNTYIDNSRHTTITDGAFDFVNAGDMFIDGKKVESQGHSATTSQPGRGNGSPTISVAPNGAATVMPPKEAHAAGEQSHTTTTSSHFTAGNSGAAAQGFEKAAQTMHEAAKKMGHASEHSAANGQEFSKPGNGTSQTSVHINTSKNVTQIISGNTFYGDVHFGENGRPDGNIRGGTTRTQQSSNEQRAAGQQPSASVSTPTIPKVQSQGHSGPAH